MVARYGQSLENSMIIIIIKISRLFEVLIASTCVIFRYDVTSLNSPYFCAGCERFRRDISQGTVKKVQINLIGRSYPFHFFTCLSSFTGMRDLTHVDDFVVVVGSTAEMQTGPSFYGWLSRAHSLKSAGSWH